MENIISDTELQDNFYTVIDGIKPDEINIHGTIKTEIKIEHSTQIEDDFFYTIKEGINHEETQIAGYDQTILSEICEIPRSKLSLDVSDAILKLNEVEFLPLLCRLCATEANDMIHIFESNELQENMIANKIKHCLPVMVKPNDTLPKQVCQLCLARLELCYQFHETVIQAEKQLLMFDEQTSGRIEETEEYNQTFSQCNEEPVVIEDEGSLNTDFDGNANDDESTTIHERFLTSDVTIIDNINPDEKRTTESLSDDLQSTDSFKEDVTSGGTSAAQIEQDSTSQPAVNNPEDVSDSELYSPPVTRSRRTSNFLRKETSRKEAIEPVTSIGQSEDCEFINCRICREHFQTVEQCHIHGSLHASTNYYPCCLCDEIFTTDKDWIEHRRMQHDAGGKISKKRVTIHECNECGKKFESKLKLKRHKLSHKSSSTGPCFCKKCDESMDSERTLKIHMLAVHNQRKKSFDKLKKTYSCYYCEKEFREEINLNTHIQLTHTGQRPFSCDFCPKTFSTKQSRKEHRRVHTGERPYKCSICTKTFTMARVLRRHEIVHSENKSYQCTLCDKSYKNLYSRKVHMSKQHAL